MTRTLLAADIAQGELKGGQRLPARDVRRALAAVATALKRKRPARISVAFVSPRQMKVLNARYRGKDYVTDVLSFRLTDPDKTPPEESFGEIILCYPKAKEQAEGMRHSVREELIFLLVHGVLHLFGFDHERPRDAKRMFPLQSKILRSLGIDDRL